MKVNHVTISLAELQEALSDFCNKHGLPETQSVRVESHDRTRIVVSLEKAGLVEAEEFRHRA